MPGGWKDWQHYKDTAKNEEWQDAGVDAFHWAFGGPGRELGLDVANIGTLGQHVAHKQLMNDPEGEALFNEMTDDEHAAYERMNAGEGQQFLEKIRARVKSKGQVDAAAKAKADQEAQYQAWKNGVMQRLDAFSKKMNMSVEELIAAGDLGIKASRNDAAAAAGRRTVGLSGGISDANTQRAVADAGLRYQMQRQQLGLQASQGLMGGLQQQYMNDEDRRRYEQGLNLQLQGAQAAAQNQKYLQEQQKRAGLMGIAGTIVGGIWGGAAGAKAGGELGQSAGNLSYANQNPYQPYQYQYPSGQTPSLGGSSNSGWGGWKPGNYQ